MRQGLVVLLAVCLAVAHGEESAPPDVLIPIGAMMPATVQGVMQIQAGVPGVATLVATGPYVAGAGPMEDIPCTVSGTATARLSTGRIEIDIQQVTVAGVSVPAKGYVIDEGDTAFGVRAQVAHVAPGAHVDPTVPPSTTPPSEEQLKIAVPHLVVAAGGKLQVVFFAAVTLPGPAVAKAQATRAARKPDAAATAPAAEQPAGLGRTLIGQPLPQTKAP